jgi:hypothetical protein
MRVHIVGLPNWEVVARTGHASMWGALQVDTEIRPASAALTTALPFSSLDQRSNLNVGH